MSKETIYVPGPMHPDLFDGETPIMLLVIADCFSVHVSLVESQEVHQKTTVIVRSEDEAKEIAIFIAQEYFTDDGDVFDAEIIGHIRLDTVTYPDVERCAPMLLREQAA